MPVNDGALDWRGVCEQFGASQDRSEQFTSRIPLALVAPEPRHCHCLQSSQHLLARSDRQKFNDRS